MRRKIARIGPSTLMVSLPASFVKRNSLKKGVEVEVTERGNELRVGVVEGIKKEKVAIRVKKGEQFLRRYLTMFYIQGDNEIEIFFEGKPQFDLVKDRLDELLGFEIVDQKKGYCLIKNVAQGLDSEFEQILRRCFLIVLEITKDSISALKNRERDRLKDFKTIEKTLDKLTNYCKRILNTKGSKEYRELTYLFLIIDYLEQIGDAYCHLCADVYERGIESKKKTLLLFERTNNLFREIYELFYKFDKQRIFRFKEKRIQLVKDLKNELNRSNDCLIISYLLSIAEKILNIELSLTYI